jgi:hypothetical protein
MALPWRAAALNAFPDDTALRSVLATLKYNGIYVLPDPKAGEQSQNQSMTGPMFSLPSRLRLGRDGRFRQ